jgi:hypothetical protein
VRFVFPDVGPLLRRRLSGTESHRGSQDWSLTIEIVARSGNLIGFKALPKRCIVERTLAWLSRFRRLTRDFERYARTVAALIRLAMIRIMLRRLVANPSS